MSLSKRPRLFRRANVESSSEDEDESGSSSDESSDRDEDNSSDDMFAEFDEMVTGQDSDGDEGMDENVPESVQDLEGGDGLTLSTPLTASTPEPVTQPTWKWSKKSNSVLAEDFVHPAKTWNVDINPDMEPLDYFKITFPEDVVQLIVDEVNRFAAQTHQAREILTKRQLKWNDVTSDEIKRYIAIRILMGIDRKPHFEHYWTKDQYLTSSVVPKIMSSNRFFEIQQNLHFANNEEQVEGDRLAKIRTFWDKLNEKSKSLINVGQNLAIDESLIKFKGRLVWKQYIPNKRNRFGIKTFSLVDSATGFVVISLIYCGKGSEDLRHSMNIYGYGGAVVLDLLETYFRKYHRVFCDNYFTSPTLARKLLDENTYLTGTLRSNRKNCPKASKLKKGDMEVFTADGTNNGIMIEYWRDKKIVRMLSSGVTHNSEAVQLRTGVMKEKPETVLEYNKYARGVDLSDMQIHFHETGRKCLKWYKKLFFRALDISIFNANIMMRSVHPKKPLIDFRLDLVKQLVESTGGYKSSRVVHVPLRQSGPHHIGYNDPTDKQVHGSRRCHVCSKSKDAKRARTSYKCIQCNISLCVVPCFEKFHKDL